MRPNILRTRTLLVGDTRVNWNNVSYFELGDDAEQPDVYYSIGIKWKYKASIKTEYLKLSKETDLYAYFKRFDTVKLGRYYINLSKIITLSEENIHGPTEKTRIRLVFTDGFELVETINTDVWVWWKTTYI